MEANSNLSPMQTGQAAPVLPITTTGTTTGAPRTELEQKVHLAAEAPLQQIEVLFDPSTQDVFIIHADTKIANPEVAAKVEKLRENTLGGTEFKEKLQKSHQDESFNAKVDAKYEQLMEGSKVDQNGKLILWSPTAGEYNLGISKDSLKELVRVSMLTSDVGQDRIISVFENGNKGTHDFYQLHGKDAANPPALLHMHKGDDKIEYKGHQLGRGAEGAVYKAMDMVGKQVRIVKENVNADPNERLHNAQTEYNCADRVNHSGTSPGLAQKPVRLFNLQRAGFGGIGLVQRFYEKGSLLGKVVKEMNLPPDSKERITLKEKMNGIEALFKGATNLSAKNLLHLDIKLDNVFVTENNEMVIADFDQVWDLQKPEDLIAKIREKRVPNSSPNVLLHEHSKKFDTLGKAMVAKDKEINELNASLKEAKPKAEREIKAKLAKAEKELSTLVDSYKKLSEFAHTWSVAYVALQILTGKPQKWADKTPELLKALDDKIKSLGPQDAVEKQYLLQMKVFLEPILNAPCPVTTTAKGELETNKGEILPAKEGVKLEAHAKNLGNINVKFEDFLKPAAKRAPVDTHSRRDSVSGKS